MPRKLADDLVHTNREYTKLRGAGTGRRTFRENPDHQLPGYRGLSRPALEAWTSDELRALARTLNIETADELTRDELIEATLKSAGRRRSNGPRG